MFLHHPNSKSENCEGITNHDNRSDVRAYVM